MYFVSLLIIIYLLLFPFFAVVAAFFGVSVAFVVLLSLGVFDVLLAFWPVALYFFSSLDGLTTYEPRRFCYELSVVFFLGPITQRNAISIKYKFNKSKVISI
jgi:hypothetical protein